MKTSKQIVVAQPGGPYRSLDLRSRERRRQLIKEIDFLEGVQEWQKRHTKKLLAGPPTGVLLFLGTGLITALSGFGAILASALAIAGVCLFAWDHRFAVLIMMLWRRNDDPTPLIKQKLNELANLPPE